MNFSIDSEFIENGETIVPISMGIVNMDNPQSGIYIEFDGVDWSKSNDFVVKNVFPKLSGVAKLGSPGNPMKIMDHYQGYYCNAEEARNIITDFVGESPEFFADYGSYDWVLLCQLYGTMDDLPETFPHHYNDLITIEKLLNIDHQGVKVTEDPDLKHHALYDALTNIRHFNAIKENTFGFKDTREHVQDRTGSKQRSR